MVLFALALSGCAALKGAEQPQMMRLAPAAAASGPRRAGGITVDPVQASGVAAGRRYTYIVAADPLLLRQAATLFWEVPPPETMTTALRAALGARFADPLSGAAGHLSARLVRFEEVAGDGHARAVVAVEAALATGGVATAGRYCRATPIAAGGSGARAAAFQDGVAAVANAVAADAAGGGLRNSDC